MVVGHNFVRAYEKTGSERPLICSQRALGPPKNRQKKSSLSQNCVTSGAVTRDCVVIATTIGFSRFAIVQNRPLVIASDRSVRSAGVM
jgi:hypothetical protein